MYSNQFAVRNGGLGVRRVSSLAPSVFLAPCAATRDLQDMILSTWDFGGIVCQRIGPEDDRSWLFRCSSSGQLVIYQATRMGQLSHTLLLEYLIGWHTSSDLSPSSVGSWQRWLASRTAFFSPWSAYGCRSCQSCGETTPWSQSLWAPSVPMQRQVSFRKHSRSRLQTQCRQNNSTPRLKRPCVAAPAHLQSKNPMVSWCQTENCRSHGRLANVWSGASHAPTPLTVISSTAKAPLRAQQTGRGWNTSS